MNLAIFAGSGNVPLAEAVAKATGTSLGRRLLARTPDGELQVEIQENVRAADVFLVQPTGPPLDQNLMELFFLADACRRAGANHITAITPYFGYARQDRSANGQQALGARLVPDLLRSAGIGRVVAVDLHTASIESAFGVALEHLSSVPLFLGEFNHASAENVVVAPDMGAFRVAERYANAWKLPLAIVAKVRVSNDRVIAQNLIGDVCGRKPIIIDDMIITGATIEAAFKKVMGAGAVGEATVIATHGLFTGTAGLRLAALPIARLLVSDSLELASHGQVPIERISLAPLLSQTVLRLHAGEPLGDLYGHG